MPIYEYRCSSCGHELETLQKLSEAPLSTCPACSRDTLVKLISAAGFQLKGSGWYATDFKSSGAKPSKPADSGAGAKSGESGADAKSGGSGADAKSGGSGADAKSGESKAGETKSEGKSESAPATACGGNCACH